MIDLEIVAPADRREHRCDHVFRQILDALATRAHEVMVVLGVARDVRRDMTLALEAAGHAVLD
ncbi:MAG TPA: hypothetical protein VFA01_01435, partial [Candidatus Dormibacteraeota bacterium]|nr:hypothetical protein [Candidatus Dormibacteraeota bacterium]